MQPLAPRIRVSAPIAKSANFIFNIEPVINANYANFGHIPYGQSLVSISSLGFFIFSSDILNLTFAFLLIRLAQYTTIQTTLICAARVTQWL